MKCNAAVIRIGRSGSRFSGAYDPATKYGEGVPFISAFFCGNGWESNVTVFLPDQSCFGRLILYRHGVPRILILKCGKIWTQCYVFTRPGIWVLLQQAFAAVRFRVAETALSGMAAAARPPEFTEETEVLQIA
jgi:hypothetical protein